MLIVFEIAPEMKLCAAAIIRMWLSTERIPRAELAAGARAVEDHVVLRLQVRRPLERHRAADIGVRRFDLRPAEAEMTQQVEAANA